MGLLTSPGLCAAASASASAAAARLAAADEFFLLLGCPSAIFAALIRLTMVLALSSGRPLVVLISLGVHVADIWRRSLPRRWLG